MRKRIFFLFKGFSKLFLGRGMIKSPLINKIWVKCFQFLRPSVINVQGSKMHLDSKDSLYLSIYGMHESFETDLFQKNVKKDNIVIDIGANIGYYTLIAAKLVGKKGKVFAFEPESANFNLLKRNIEINHYKNVVLEKKAVSNITGESNLYLCDSNKGDHRLYDSHDNREYVSVKTVRLDDYFKNKKVKIDLIKLDIQGAEGGALEGMLNLLKKNKNCKIITEFWPLGLKKFGTDPKKYLDLFIKYGFKLNCINEKTRKIEPINVSTLIRIYTSEKGNHTNLYCSAS